MANENTRDQSFSLLKDVLEKKQSHEIPSRIFNCDESVVNMDAHTGKIVVSRN